MAWMRWWIDFDGTKTLQEYDGASGWHPVPEVHRPEELKQLCDVCRKHLPLREFLDANGRRCYYCVDCFGG